MLHTRTLAVLSLFIALLSTTNSWGQIDFSVHEREKKGFLYFKNLSVDFGTFSEGDGIQSGTFVAYNIYKYPLVIVKIQPGCGCTSVEHNKDTIAAGDSLVINVTYDPKNRPGPFNKAIMVYNTGIPHTVTLNIKGEATPRVKTKADNYSIDLGSLKMTNTYYDFGFMYRDEVDTFNVGIYNSGDKPISILGISGRPSYIMMSVPSLEIQPEQEIVLSLIYDARLANDYGDMLHFLTLKTSDPYINEIPLNVNAHLLERFPPQTKRRVKKNPKVRFEQEEINTGKILKGDTAHAVYVIHNDGKRPLIIRKVQPSCGCTLANADKMEIAPGDSAHITIHFNTLGREGDDTKSITVITNDPARPVAKIFLKTTIVENPNAL